MFRRTCAIVLVAMAAVACLGAVPRRAAAPTEIDRLAAMMAGSYSSAAQAAADTTYFDVRLRMTPIWPSRTDGHWLYVEQAIADSQDKPYRQRVYHLQRGANGELRSVVYTLPAPPLRFAGAWKSDAPLATLTPDSLTLRDGCAIVLLRQEDGSFRGSTHEHDCPSDLRGATYATSEVAVSDSVLQSWDRGFDATGKQMWGAVAGPYRFVKLSASARP